MWGVGAGGRVCTLISRYVDTAFSFPSPESCTLIVKATTPAPVTASQWQQSKLDTTFHSHLLGAYLSLCSTCQVPAASQGLTGSLVTCHTDEGQPRRWRGTDVPPSCPVYTWSCLCRSPGL